ASPPPTARFPSSGSPESPGAILSCDPVPPTVIAPDDPASRPIASLVDENDPPLVMDRDAEPAPPTATPLNVSLKLEPAPSTVTVACDPWLRARITPIVASVPPAERFTIPFPS